MGAVKLRPMTLEEFAEWQTAIAEEFAAAQIAAGNWEPEGAVQRAIDANAQMLPNGLSTPRMLILRGITGDGEAIGRVWVGLDHPRGAPNTAFLHDIEVDEQHRGRGLGHDLLAAVESTVRDAGIGALELNVFGGNVTAVHLYESTGYEVTTQQMRKRL